MTVIRIAAIICLTFLFWFTSSKIIKMAKIRGWISSDPPVSKLITNRAVFKDTYGDAYWVAWDDADISVASPNRMNLPEPVWDRFSVGDSIEVFYFPDSKWPHHQEGIFASNGNFGFDGVLLSIWASGIVYLCVSEIRTRRKRRARRPPRLPT